MDNPELGKKKEQMKMLGIVGVSAAIVLTIVAIVVFIRRRAVSNDSKEARSHPLEPLEKGGGGEVAARGSNGAHDIRLEDDDIVIPPQRQVILPPQQQVVQPQIRNADSQEQIVIPPQQQENLYGYTSAGLGASPCQASARIASMSECEKALEVLAMRNPKGTFKVQSADDPSIPPGCAVWQSGAATDDPTNWGYFNTNETGGKNKLYNVICRDLPGGAQ